MLWKEWVLDLFFPPRCLLCGCVVESGKRYCSGCLRRYFLPPEEQSSALGPLTVFTLFRDGPDSRKSVARIKFQGDLTSLEYFALELVKLLRNQGLQDSFDGVAFVPMPVQRQQQRGYNQAEELARIVAKELGLPLLHGFLEKRDLLTQHELPGSLRRKRKGGCRLSTENRLDGKRILLLDDICTTGETMRECSMLLEQAGASLVTGLVLLRRCQEDTEWDEEALV